MLCVSNAFVTFVLSPICIPLLRIVQKFWTEIRYFLHDKDQTYLHTICTIFLRCSLWNVAYLGSMPIQILPTDCVV